MKTAPSLLSDYINVMKPSIAMLNVFVGIATILLAVGLSAPVPAIAAISLAGFLAAGGAGAINCYIDRDLDKQMSRTRGRPVPDGRIPATQVLTLGLTFSLASIGIAVLYLNLLTAFFIALGIFWYIVVYTMWLKPRTKWNIVIGGAAGCFSALAGWSAVTGSVGLVGILVASLIFLWTPGHFWGLAIARAKDYTVGNVPMLPAVDGLGRASFDTALSNMLLFPFTLLLYLLTVNWSNVMMALIIGAAVVALNVRFFATNLRLARRPEAMLAWRVFKLSVQYLFLVLILIVVGHIL